MPHFFIDFRDGDKEYLDECGSEVENLDQARKESIASLTQFAKDVLPDGEHRKFVSTVRDASGTILYRATIVFYGERLFARFH